jgi:MoaA/NifB/PqqE/SkfB family radical SAM enzyme
MLSAPNKVDILLTTRCQSNCNHCFAPKGYIEELEALEWLKIIVKLYEYGTKEIVFTGGEPTLYSDLDVIAKYCKELGIRTTLSTNGMSDIDIYEEVLPYIDEIGISIDTVKEEFNIENQRGVGQIEKAVSLIKKIHEEYRDIELTVRTVIIQTEEYEHIFEIPSYLESRGVNFSELQWKVYEPLFPDFDELIYQKPEDDITMEFNRFLLSNLEILEMKNLEIYRISDRDPYMLILPNGDVEVSDIMAESHVEWEVGNIFRDDITEIMAKIELLEDNEIPTIRIS